MLKSLFFWSVSAIYPWRCRHCGKHMRHVLPSDVSPKKQLELRKKRMLGKVVEKGWVCYDRCHGEDKIVLVET